MSTSQKLLSAQSQLDLDSEHFHFVILIDQNVCPKGGYHSKKKTLVLTPPPKSCERQIYFFLIHDQKTIMRKIKKNSPLKTPQKLLLIT